MTHFLNKDNFWLAKISVNHNLIDWVLDYEIFTNHTVDIGYFNRLLVWSKNDSVIGLHVSVWQIQNVWKPAAISSNKRSCRPATIIIGSGVKLADEMAKSIIWTGYSINCSI